MCRIIRSSRNIEQESSQQQFGSIQDETGASFWMLQKGCEGKNNFSLNLTATGLKQQLHRWLILTPSQNYNITPIRKHVGDLSGIRNHGSMQRGTSSSCSSCTVTVPDRSEYYYKDISLLSNSSYDQVPRSSAKVSLLEDGLYLDPSKLDKSRGEVRL